MVDATAAGQSVNCPVCSKSIVVPVKAEPGPESAPTKFASQKTSHGKAWMLGGLVALVSLLAIFLIRHAGTLSRVTTSSPSAAAGMDSSTLTGFSATFEQQQTLVEQADLGEPQAVLNLLDKAPALANNLDLLAKTPLRWALAQGPSNARQLLAGTTTQMSALLRGLDATAGSMWLEKLESQPDRSGLRSVEKSFPKHPQYMEGIKYQHGFWSRGWDAGYNVLLNGKAKRLSILIGLDDSTGTNGHLRFLITAGRSMPLRNTLGIAAWPAGWCYCCAPMGFPPMMNKDVGLAKTGKELARM